VSTYEASRASVRGVRGLGRERADATRDEQDGASVRFGGERAPVVRIGRGTAPMPLDRSAVRADDRADVGECLVGGRPSAGNLLDVREGDVLQRRGRIARRQAQ